MGKKTGLPTAVCIGNRANTLPVDTVSFAISGEGFFESEGPCRCAVVMEMLQPLDAFRPVGNMPPIAPQRHQGFDVPIARMFQGVGMHAAIGNAISDSMSFQTESDEGALSKPCCRG